MKRLILIPLLLFCVTAFGQFTKPELYENINTNIRLKTYSPTRISAVLDSIVVTMGSGSGSSDYTPQGVTLATVGGIASGTNLGVTAIPIQDLLDDIFYPYISPVFSSFSVSGQNTTIENGTTLSGSKTFTWGVTLNSGTVSTIDLYDVTAGSTLLAGTANDGTQAQTITTIQLNSNGATQVWRGVGNDTGGGPTPFNSSTFTVTSRFYRFYGPTASSPANSAAVRALASSAFHTGATSFTFNTGTVETKFVIALPPSVTISTVIDTSALNVVITSEWILTGTINVLDAGSTNRAYNIYEMNVGVPYATSHAFTVTTAN